MNTFTNPQQTFANPFANPFAFAGACNTPGCGPQSFTPGFTGQTPWHAGANPFSAFPGVSPFNTINPITGMTPFNTFNGGAPINPIAGGFNTVPFGGFAGGQAPINAQTPFFNSQVNPQINPWSQNQPGFGFGGSPFGGTTAPNQINQTTGAINPWLLSMLSGFNGINGFNTPTNIGGQVNTNPFQNAPLMNTPWSPVGQGVSPFAGATQGLGQSPVGFGQSPIDWQTAATQTPNFVNPGFVTPNGVYNANPFFGLFPVNGQQTPNPGAYQTQPAAQNNGVTAQAAWAYGVTPGVPFAGPFQPTPAGVGGEHNPAGVREAA